MLQNVLLGGADALNCCLYGGEFCGAPREEVRPAACAKARLGEVTQPGKIPYLPYAVSYATLLML